LLLFACTYLLLSARASHSVKIGSHVLALPELRMSALQMLSASLDWVITSLVLYVLLPFGAVPFGIFLSAFLAAHVAGVLSNIPGGLGVFEAMLLLLLGPFLPESAVIGSIVIYRFAYYLLPLIVSILLFCVHEAQTKKHHWQMLARWIGVR
jgi:phosphatidylglycerol lysyltransferase